MGNGLTGIFLSTNPSSGNTVGGTVSGAGNIIAFNGTVVCGGPDHSGVTVSGDTAINNAVLGNSIFSNDGLGIDLNASDGPCGVTDNDNCDTETGPNNLQNYPVIISVTSGGGNTSIQGSLNSTANTRFRVEFFDSAQCHSSGFGQGETFIGSADITTDGNCNATIDVTFPVTVGSGHVITATATDPSNNTSEFSACTVAQGGTPTPTPTATATGHPVRATPTPRPRPTPAPRL